MRVLVAGVGYTNLRDMSVGPLLVEQLAAETWPPDVEVRDLGYGAVHVAHDLQDLQDTAPFERLVLFGATVRGRPPGSVTCYRWDGVLPGPDDVQAQVAEAVTGTISLDGVLIVGRQLGALPDDIIVVEIEPADDSWGPAYSPVIEGVLPDVVRAIRQAALTARPPVPTLPLGSATAEVLTS